VLCSDGLSNQVSAEEMGRLARGNAQPEDICKALIEEAMHTGAPDNVTVVVARMRTPDAEHDRMAVAG
jgi:PPM family protein phosphatase